MPYQTVIVAGGSKGLGRSLAIRLVSAGASVILLARSIEPLQQTTNELLALRPSPATQTVTYHPLDLSSAPAVESFVSSLPIPLPTTLFCVAGGTSEEIGFFADINPTHIHSCMAKNYLSAAYITNHLLKRWLAHPPPSPTSTTRHIIFTASTAAFIALPGYAAYTPSKTATRALADTLRQELLLYAHQQTIRVHCSFPGTIHTDAFTAEQALKPLLSKQLERSDDPTTGLSPNQVADKILLGLRKGFFFITMDLDTETLLNNMRGPSPRDRPVRDWLLGFIGALVWPFYRMSFDAATRKYGRDHIGMVEAVKKYA